MGGRDGEETAVRDEGEYKNRREGGGGGGRKKDQCQELLA